MKSFKNNLLNITIMSMKVDDCVKIKGGKSKRCEGTIQSLMNTFALVRITKDKKGVAIFGDKPTKVKKEYMEVIKPPPLEMPTQGDLKPVDSLNPVNDIFDLIDKKLIGGGGVKEVKETITNVDDPESDHENSNPNELSQTKKVTIQENYMINENNVKSPAITMDDAMNLKEENWKLKTQLESMLAFQGEACKEVSDLKWLIKDLKEQLDDSVRLEHLEEVRNILNNIL
jgi:hypothetical protein